MALYRLLHSVAGITQKLQGHTIDAIDAYQNVNTSIEDIQLLQENVDLESDVIFKQVVRIVDQLNVEPIIPRVAKKQIYRDSVPVNSPEEYYKQALVIPIVDTFTSETTHCFNKFNCKAVKLLILIPPILCCEKFKENVDISPILEDYEEELIKRDVVDQALPLWQRMWLAVAFNDQPHTLAKAIKECYVERFPNLFVLLKIACTFSITSAECKRTLG